MNIKSNQTTPKQFTKDISVNEKDDYLTKLSKEQKDVFIKILKKSSPEDISNLAQTNKSIHNRIATLKNNNPILKNYLDQELSFEKKFDKFANDIEASAKKHKISPRTVKAAKEGLHKVFILNLHLMDKKMPEPLRFVLCSFAMANYLQYNENTKDLILHGDSYEYFLQGDLSWQFINPLDKEKGDPFKKVLSKIFKDFFPHHDYQEDIKKIIPPPSEHDSNEAIKRALEYIEKNPAISLENLNFDKLNLHEIQKIFSGQNSFQKRYNEMLDNLLSDYNKDTKPQKFLEFIDKINTKYQEAPKVQTSVQDPKPSLIGSMWSATSSAVSGFFSFGFSKNTETPQRKTSKK